MEFRGVYYSYLGCTEAGLKCSVFPDEASDISAERVVCVGIIPPLPRFTPAVFRGEMNEDGLFAVSEMFFDSDKEHVVEFLQKSKYISDADIRRFKNEFTGSDFWRITEEKSAYFEKAGISENGKIFILNLVYQIRNAWFSAEYMKKLGFSYENTDAFFKRRKSFSDLIERPYAVGADCALPLSLCDKMQQASYIAKNKRGNIAYPFDENGRERLEFITKRAVKIIEGNGHSYVHLSELEYVLKRAAGRENAPDMDLLLLSSLKNPLFKVNGDKICLAKYLSFEETAARNLKRIAAWRLPDLSEESLPKKFDEGQKAAINGALQNTVSVITGGPGTGKTTITRQIVKMIEDKGRRVLLAAPTGRAAAMMKEKTGHSASTIHRLIGIHGISLDTYVAANDETNPLVCDALILDESSMISLDIFAAVLRAVPDRCRLIFIGDADQLPSVSPGDILYQMIKSGAFPVFRLTETHRQQDGSSIIENAGNILYGRRLWPSPDFSAADYASEEEALKFVLNLFMKRHDEGASNSLQILCPVKKGELGTKNINTNILRRIRGENARGFEKDDRVMTIRNSYKPGQTYINGESGIIKSITDGTAEIAMAGGDTAYVSDFADIVHSYAITIHKSQGSEYDCAVIVIGTDGIRMLTKQMLYTAVTRAKREVRIITVGNPDLSALRKEAVRNSGLSEMLRD